MEKDQSQSKPESPEEQAREGLAAVNCSGLAEIEDRRPIPLMEPSLLFDEETANSINWKAYYPYYPF